MCRRQKREKYGRPWSMFSKSCAQARSREALASSGGALEEATAYRNPMNDEDLTTRLMSWVLLLLAVNNFAMDLACWRGIGHVLA